MFEVAGGWLDLEAIRRHGGFSQGDFIAYKS